MGSFLKYVHLLIDDSGRMVLSGSVDEQMPLQGAGKNEMMILLHTCNLKFSKYV
jgi:hypothetical protein